MPEIKIDWIATARANAVEMDKGRMECRPEEAALLCGLADEIERLREIAIRAGAMGEAPCKICGYNGPGYFQPLTHAFPGSHRPVKSAYGGRADIDFGWLHVCF